MQVFKMKKSQKWTKVYIIFQLINVFGIKIIFSSLYGCKPLNYACFRRFSQFEKNKVTIELRTQKVRDFQNFRYIIKYNKFYSFKICKV
jgi:hypothetical protein